MAELNMSLFPQYKTPVAAQAEGFNYAQAIQDAAQQNQARQAQQQAGGQYANGDYGGASQTLARSGDIKGAEAVRGTQQKSTAASLEYVSKALPVLQGVLKAHANDPDGGRGAMGQAFDSIAQEAQMATGASPQSLAQFRQGLVTDPQGTLARIEAQLPIAYERVGNTLVRRQGDTATPIYHGQSEAPSGYEIGPDGHTLQPRAGGPADPKVVHALGLDKREIIVNNPTPQSGNNSARRDAQLGIQYRKEFDQLPDIKQYNEIANASDIVSGLASRNGSAQDDIAAIFSFMKALDPNSVVRETEFATAQNAAGIPERVRNFFNQAQNGQRLSQNQRKEFAGTVKSVLNSRKPRYKQLVKQYKDYVTSSGLPESYIQERIESPDIAPQAASAAAPPLDPKTEALLAHYGVPK